MMKHSVTVTVNGTVWELDVDPAEVLLEVLRERVGVKSPKIGCERGDCGSCTVMLDGHTVRSCLVLGVEVDGSEILTIEGLSDDGLTRLQERMVELSSFQCGFCAPGIVLAAHELMQHHPRPTQAQVEEAISGNLCRCTGYTPIIEAVMAVVDPGAGEEVAP
jgi:carbon-monoxide dehydrogenase small subunit